MSKKEYVPYFKRNKTQNQTNTRREWDDDYDQSQRTAFENSSSNTDFIGKSVNYHQINNEKSNEKSNLIETKLIDEITKPTGISFQPSDTQLNELVKRAKGLNMEYLYEILLNKIYSYENYDNQNLIKSFIKSLYCIYVLMKEYPLFKDLMTESLSLIYSIKDYFSISNKKVYEITVLIIKIVIVDSNEDSSNDYDNTVSTTYHTQSEMKHEENPGKDVDLFENEENSTEKTSKLKFIKSKNKSSKVISSIENIFETTDDKKPLVKSSISSIFDSIPKEIDFTNTVNAENIFENKEKLEKERKLNELLNSISAIESNQAKETKDNQSLEVSFFNNLNINQNDDKNSHSTSNISMSNLNDRLFLESHPLIKEQIDSQYKYLLSAYGENNKENLYEYAKQIVLNNPLLKNLLNKEKERIIICKEDKSFNSKLAFGEKEEKDSFDFVNDLLKK